MPSDHHGDLVKSRTPRTGRELGGGRGISAYAKFPGPRSLGALPALYGRQNRLIEGLAAGIDWAFFALAHSECGP